MDNSFKRERSRRFSSQISGYPPVNIPAGQALWIQTGIKIPTVTGTRGKRENKKIFSLFCTKDQKSFFPLEGWIAFGCSMDSPSRSQRYSCLVRGRTSDEVLGHWNLPDSRRLYKSTNPVLSKYNALILSALLLQKRNRALVMNMDYSKAMFVENGILSLTVNGG